MAQEKIYPKGIIAFSKNEKTPDFVKGSVIINPRELVDWIKENPQLLTEYKDQKQLKLQLLEGQKGLYFTVDTYKKTEISTPAPAPSTSSVEDDSMGLPF